MMNGSPFLAVTLTFLKVTPLALRTSKPPLLSCDRHVLQQHIFDHYCPVKVFKTTILAL